MTSQSDSHSKASGKKSSMVFRTTLVLSLLCLSALVAENLNLRIVPALHPFSQEKITTKPRESVMKRSLPNFENGGVVIFNHIAKTGGTTIRENFSKLPNVEWQFVGGLDDLLEYSKEVDRRLTNKIKDNKTLFLELHGPVPGMFTLHDFLNRWQKIAEKEGTSFFAFTMVRDPVAYSVSFFNFILAEPCLFNGCPYKTWPVTEENFIESAQPNYQCHYMARDVTWFDFTEKQSIPPLATEYECDAVYNVMKLDMDWIGTTEKMSTETMPLLTHMLVNEKQKGPSLETFNEVEKKKPVVIKTEALQDATVEYIRAISQYDQAIYDKVKRDYPIDMWEDLSSTDPA
jgi:hypothetical protein